MIFKSCKAVVQEKEVYNINVQYRYKSMNSYIAFTFMFARFNKWSKLFSVFMAVYAVTCGVLRLLQITVCVQTNPMHKHRKLNILCKS